MKARWCNGLRGGPFISTPEINAPSAFATPLLAVPPLAAGRWLGRGGALLRRVERRLAVGRAVLLRRRCLTLKPAMRLLLLPALERCWLRVGLLPRGWPLLLWWLGRVFIWR